jgi:hypothetical protein
LRTITPEIIRRDGEMYLTIPTDADYPITEERLEGAIRG